MTSNGGAPQTTSGLLACHVALLVTRGVPASNIMRLFLFSNCSERPCMCHEETCPPAGGGARVIRKNCYKKLSKSSKRDR